ncbi:MAG TPA: biotin--[acetyl-CoA-carboxylase] ligase [Rhizomicrobium sp.]
MTLQATWPAAYALRQFAELDSTNEEARRLAASGIEGPIWIRADRQTSGRGRRGNVWVSTEGNLAATLLLRPDRPTAICAQLSFVAALAASDMIAAHAPMATVRVKWPNDVLVDEKKIAGILLESAQGRGARPDWLGVGIGVNLVSRPDDTEFPAIALSELGVRIPEAAEALTALAIYWDRWHQVWLERGFAPLRDAWLARAARLGERIRARFAHGETRGVFEGIDESGALILREHHGAARAIPAGEIYF